MSRLPYLPLLFAPTILLGACRGGDGAPGPTPLEITESRVRPGEESDLVANGIRFRVAPDVAIRIVTEGASLAVRIEERPLSLAGGELRIGERSYGKVAAGGEVCLADGAVTVNGERRGAL